jgi:ADP-heptose:LPS heptosyltransferase
MAQTWPVSKKRIAALKFADTVGRAFTWPFRRRPSVSGPIDSILVIEPWNIGDVVLVTPLLTELRRRLPKARISLLARDYARDLLDGSGLVDEIIVARLPWTAPKNKYRITPAVAGELRRLITALRRQRFDVSIDSRMDIRSNLLAAAIGARHRVGYDIGGGGWLLTSSLPSDRDRSHKVDDWLALLDVLPGQSTTFGAHPRPTLVVKPEEGNRARRTLQSLGAVERPVIGYHPGGSHPGKRWPRKRFEQLISDLRNTEGGSHIVFLGPDEKDSDPWPAGTVIVCPSLRELMAFLTCCDVLVCNDSGPMHVADALGVPVAAIFEIGNPQWFGPSGPRATVIAGELAGTGLSAAPLYTPPRNPVPVTCVTDVVRRTLRTQS